MSHLWIYFLGVGSDLVKIGKSRQSRNARLEQHRKPTLDGHTPKVVLLCEIRGCDADEKALHRYFDEFRAGAGVESFRAVPQVVDYVRWLRDLSYVAVEDTTDELRDSLPLVDAEVWMPRPERVKQRDKRLLPGMYPFDIGPRVVTIDDYYTNAIIIEAARRTMGSIDTDPATHPIANTVVKAETFYTAATNGLDKPWTGNVWLNPPFSEWSVWAAKLSTEVQSGRASQACVLAALRTISAKYFSVLLRTCDALAVLRGRIPFWGDRAGDSLNDGHVILYFGERVEQFLDEFRHIGSVFTQGSKVATEKEPA